jgi:hypothetical protein
MWYNCDSAYTACHPQQRSSMIELFIMIYIWLLIWGKEEVEN